LGVFGSAHGIYISGGGSAVGGPFLVDSCQIYNNTGDPNSFGITVYTGANNTLNNVTVSNNIVSNNSYGIQVGYGSNDLVYNNIVKDNLRMGIDVAYGSPNNARIYNNLIYGNGWHGILVGDYGSPTNTIIANNIIARNAGNAVHLVGSTGAVVQSNLTFRNASGNTTNIAPGFVNEAAEDFHLLSNSPAVDAGVTLPEVTVDFDGNARPYGPAYDIGPYEYVGAPDPFVSRRPRESM
jgi:parallel beta-helix repeat protein